MKRIDLVYLANPVYGGWVSYTAHLFYRLNKNYRVRLFKIAKRRENSKREFGYGVKYRNITGDDIALLHNPIITAVDKHHVDLLDYFIYQPQFDERGLAVKAILTVHDTTELPVVRNYLSAFRILAIRRTVARILREEYLCKDVLFIHHPFFRFSRQPCPKEKTGAIALSRIDWDKHTDIIVDANEQLCEKDKCDIWGVHNRAYVKRSMNWDHFFEIYKGRFDKSFAAVEELLRCKRFLVDMSSIKRDGVGSQYTFLEAIHCGCALVLNSEWFKLGADEDGLIPDYNCFAVSDAAELAKVLSQTSADKAAMFAKRAKRILAKHVWDYFPKEIVQWLGNVLKVQMKIY